MKLRRHHNNKGLRQIKLGTTRKDVEKIALKIASEQKQKREGCK